MIGPGIHLVVYDYNYMSIKSHRTVTASNYLSSIVSIVLSHYCGVQFTCTSITVTTVELL